MSEKGLTLRPWMMPLLLAIGVVTVVVLGDRRLDWVSYPAEEVASQRNPHAYQGKPLCQRCHEGSDGRLRGDPIELCSGCHVFDHGNHPVRVVQSKPANVGLPLLPGGLVACHTCHDAHDLTRHEDGLRLPFNDLCLVCHPAH